MNEDKFVCFGTYQNIFKCLIKCPFQKECEIRTMNNKGLKEIAKEINKNENTKDNKG